MIAGASVFGAGADPFADPLHLAWLARQRDRLLGFYEPEVRLPGAGFAFLDAEGRAEPGRGSQLWLGARMMHCFAIAQLMGRTGADELVRHGLDFYVDGAGRDARHGGWFATVGGEAPSDRKELYGQAHVVLGASSACLAGHARAGTLLDEALDVVDRHYWRESDGRCVEAYDRSFLTLDSYRGQNANMHLTEAYLAAFEVTGDHRLLERASRIAAHIAGGAASAEAGAWRLPEHFDENWQPVWDFNRNDPRHAFRPYGSQPGHWLEWAKLLLQLRGQGVDERWLLPAAEHLFAGAFADGWHATGGFVYTVDWDGRPVVGEKFWWEVTEGIGAARALHLATGDPRYAAAYARLWEFAARHFIDPATGAWFHEIDADNSPVLLTWAGKPDLYHAYQATLYALVPATLGLAAWAAQAVDAEPAQDGPAD